MYGDPTTLKKADHLIQTATGNIPITGGCGYHITHGAGALAITAGGGGLTAGAGYGHPDLYLRPHGLCGCITTATAAGIQFHRG